MTTTAPADSPTRDDAPAFGEPIVDYPASYSRKNGIKVPRRLTTEAGGPFGGITFVTASAKVVDQATGQVIKELDGLEVPDSWGQMSIDIWATKYLRKVDVPLYDADDQLVRDDDGNVVYGSEKSVRQWALRLANAWMLWGRRGGYFASKKDSVAFRDEVAHMVATQMASPNSPQHFNTGIWEAYGPTEDAHGNWYVDPEDGVAKQSPHKYFRSAVNACFIASVKDDLVNEGGIFDFFTREARLFKDGSGSGANMSNIRAENEPLSGGGESSGVMSFVKTGDYNAGAIKSGGRTRRAAKMVVLDADHPDIDQFIQCKVDAEKMAAGLIDAGYSAEWNDPDGAYAQVPFQNANHSVGVTHGFMDAAFNGESYDLIWRKSGQVARTINASELMDDIAEAAWICADPGMQFNGTMNDWHTGAHDGPIRGSNPCFPGSARVHTDKGMVRFDELVHRTAEGESFDVYTHDATNDDEPASVVHLTTPEQIMITGRNPIVELSFSNGQTIRCTPNHRIWTHNRGYVRADELTSDDVIQTLDVDAPAAHASHAVTLAADCRVQPGVIDTDKRCVTVLPEKWSDELAHFLGYLVGDGNISVGRTNHTTYARVQVTYGGEDEQSHLLPGHRGLLETLSGGTGVETVDMDNGTKQLRLQRRDLVEYLRGLGFETTEGGVAKRVPYALYEAPEDIVAAFLRGLYDADGCVVNDTAKGTRYVGLASISRGLLQGVQQLLLTFGIQSRIYKTKDAAEDGGFTYTTIAGEEVEYGNREMFDLRISSKNIETFAARIGFNHPTRDEKLRTLLANHSFHNKAADVRLVDYVEDGFETTYNLTEPRNNSYIVDGIVVANCSEYIYLDDTACNLASLNLVKFEADGAGTFDADLYGHAVRLWTVVLEISVSMAHYPSRPLAENSFEHRTLGLGYANVGALLMRAGLPYDSDEGRAVLAAVTALMHFGAGAASAELADAVGPCDAWGRNVEPMSKVLRNHVRAAFGPDKDAADLGDYEDLTVLPQELDPTHLELAGYGDLLQPVRDTALESLAGIDRSGYRNMQWTVLAPTGTIGLQMGCDTTGIEPGFMLKMWKKLAGGGSMEIVNESVPVALRQLGYSDEKVDAIVAHVAATGRIEDADDLDERHVPVFDTANRNGGGQRYLSGEAHVRATAAAQPFLSGGISKTINLPADATVADVRYVYELAYRLGVKCTSVYRDKSKRSQVLSDAGVDEPSTSEQAGELTALLESADDIEVGTSPAEFYGATRPLKFRMQRSRAAQTDHIEIGGQDVFVTFGEYSDGTLGEIFLKTAKQGTYVNALYELFAMAVSIGLQHGVPLAEFVKKFTGHQFEPSGVVVGHPNLKMAKSPVDAAFRIGAFKYLGRDDLVQVADRDTIAGTQGAAPAAGGAAAAAPAAEPRGDVDDGNLSDCCGAPKIQTGTCAVCTSCGTSEGCS